MSDLKYPRLWRHRTNKKKMRVMPWWEIPDPILDSETIKAGTGVDAKIGVLVQIGYLLENEHGMWFGVGPKAADFFMDMGEWVKPKKQKKRT